jgi:hypothetical protein
MVSLLVVFVVGVSQQPGRNLWAQGISEDWCAGTVITL